jgi:enoyl-CoA hydratase/carnithine racemase
MPSQMTCTGMMACVTTLLALRNGDGSRLNRLSSNFCLRHPPRIRDLVGVLDHAKVKDDISAVVLTGDGPYFSSGADIKDFVNNFSPSETDEGRNSLKLPVGKFMMAMLQFPKVLAAAVNGPCIGIATTLLFHCDLCVCSPQATFWAPFTRLALGTYTWQKH